VADSTKQLPLRHVKTECASGGCSRTQRKASCYDCEHSFSLTSFGQANGTTKQGSGGVDRSAPFRRRTHLALRESSGARDHSRCVRNRWSHRLQLFAFIWCLRSGAQSVTYRWEIDGISRRVCPNCNRTLERRQSSRAINSL